MIAIGNDILLEIHLNAVLFISFAKIKLAWREWNEMKNENAAPIHRSFQLLRHIPIENDWLYKQKTVEQLNTMCSTYIISAELFSCNATVNRFNLFLKTKSEMRFDNWIWMLFG